MKILVAIAGSMLIGASANAAVVDMFDMSVGSSSTNSTAVLSNGTDYLITVSGTFEIGCGNPCPADAEYYFFNDQSYDRTGFSNDDSGVEVGVGINGSDIDWGPYQPSNVYSTLFVGLGSTVSMFYQDSNPGDNLGSLQVKIETITNGPPANVIPLPAGLPLMLAGLGALGFVARRKGTA